MAIIAASILDADFGNLKHEVDRVARAGVDMFTLDIMDGSFAPRITFGDYVVACIRGWTDLPLEVHLMIEEPERSIENFLDSGVDLVVFHLEASKRHSDIISAVHERNRAVGMALLATTPVQLVFDWVRELEVVNFLTVPVGFGGQKSAPDTLQRVKSLREFAKNANPNLVIEVDGGVKPHNAAEHVAAGADMLTVGTGIYHAPDAEEAVRKLREETAGSLDELARQRGSTFLNRRPLSAEEKLRRDKHFRELQESLDVRLAIP
jgi:ribulose-phosphate 3-epimerase